MTNKSLTILIDFQHGEPQKLVKKGVYQAQISLINFDNRETFNKLISIKLLMILLIPNYLLHLLCLAIICNEFVTKHPVFYPAPFSTRVK